MPQPPPRSGRKRAALTYCITYTLGCLTKHFNSFWVLAGGRVLCGVATSLLFSAFESWLVAEHNKVGAALPGKHYRRGVLCTAPPYSRPRHAWRRHCQPPRAAASANAPRRH